LDKARSFLKWLKNNSIKPEDIDYMVPRRSIAHLRIDRRVSDETLRVYIRMLRILGKDNLAKQLKYSRYTVKHIDLPSQELVEKIIDTIKQTFTDDLARIKRSILFIVHSIKLPLGSTLDIFPSI